MSAPGPICVCVPARNEAARIGTLLDALAAQDSAGPLLVVVALNNCTDASAQAVRAAQARHAARLSITLIDETFDDARPDAGRARALAMDAGLKRVGSAGVLLSTDADTRPPANWVSANLAAIGRGLDLAGGRLVLDEREPLPPYVAAARRSADAYWEAARAAEDAVDPLPWDLPPRHGDHTGASLAITARCYARCGGVPELASGEDVALVARALALGARLGHPPDIWTRVSPRIAGRARGGMADAMRELARGTPAALPPISHWAERARLRREARAGSQAA